MSGLAGVVPASPAVRRRWSVADVSVNVKILAAVTVAGLVALAVGALGLSALGNTSEAAQRIYSGNLASVRAIGAVDKAVVQARLDTAFQLISQDDTGTKKYTDAFDADLANFDTAFTGYQDSHPAGDPAVIADLQARWRAYVQVV